ncbi:MAG: IPT/TIG domain-containing protein [Rikenellaceae bacterium]
MKTINYIKALLTCLLCALFMSCNEDILLTTTTVEDPVITGFTPQSGEVGTEVTIYGENLQSIQSATIGGGEAPLKYRISENEMVVTIGTDTRSGTISVVNNFSVTASSEESFSVTYKTPDVTSTEYPETDETPTSTEAEDGHWGESSQMMVFNGEYLHFVDEVLFGTTAGTIITQRSNELVVEIPLINVSEDVDLKLTYYDGSADNSENMGVFHVIVLVPTITSDIPSSLTKYSPITLTGYNMNLFNSFSVVSDEGETVSLTIKSQSSTAVSLDINTNFFEASFTGEFTAIYNNDQSMTISYSFELIADPDEPRYYTYTSVYVDGRSTQGDKLATDMSFLDLETSKVTNPDGVVSDPGSIDMAFYDGSTTASFRGAHNTSGVLKNWTTSDGTALTTALGDNTSLLYANTVKSKALDPTDADQAAVIAAYEAGTFIYLSCDDDGTAIDPLIAAIDDPSTSSPTIYYSNGEILCLGVTTQYILIKRTTPDYKYGIIKVQEVNIDSTGMAYSMTFDYIWSL